MTETVPRSLRVIRPVSEGDGATAFHWALPGQTGVRALLEPCRGTRAAFVARSVALVLAVVPVGCGRSDTTPDVSGLTRDVRVRVAEAYRLIDAVAHSFWEGWDDAPRSVLLLTEDSEFLLHHPSPPDDFQQLHYDSLVESEVWRRDRTLPLPIAATIPIGDQFTVVLGPPGAIGTRSATSWVLTLVHEHFHQLQLSDSAYMTAVMTLAPAVRDTTGTWMVSHAFPYDSVPVAAALQTALQALHAALRARGSGEFPAALGAYRRAHAEFAGQLSTEDREYLEFQLWQEGVPRYVELMVSRLAARGLPTDADSYVPSSDFLELSDFLPYSDLAASFERRVVDELPERDPAIEGREIVYPYGAAVALLLDRAAPDWKTRYRTERFSLHTYLDR